MSIINRGDAPHTATQPIGEVNGQSFFNISYTNYPRQELSSSDPNYSRERGRAINHNSKDGIKPMTKEEQDFERQLNKTMIKKFTMAIFSFDVTKFSFPVGYNEPRTFIERASDLFCFLATSYMEKVVRETDPQQRLSLFTIGIIAAFHLYAQPKKPWNPVLGETFVGKWPNGITIYGEQTSHHPPVSNVQITSPDNSWKVDAQFNFEIDQGIFQIDIIQKGKIVLTIYDGTRYVWEFPTISVFGIIKGERTIRVKSPLEIRDETHKLTSYVQISPKKNKKINELKHARVTTVYGGVFHGKTYDEKKTKFTSIISGDYASKLYINGEQCWDIATDLSQKPLEIIPDDEILPSDCRYRIDRGFLIQNDMDTAENAKKIIEELQRRDAKLRSSDKKGKKENTKKTEKQREREEKLQKDLKNIDHEIESEVM
ncbi:hypothetical protein M9Y10_017387 [Tritrichomonas musculus]|uniref:Oxysterol binding protein n=1 Tax=Tritrichomonas musculus TaxID=1915356 RepID=A0ABR2HUA0_9EUKA